MTFQRLTQSGILLLCAVSMIMMLISCSDSTGPENCDWIQQESGSTTLLRAVWGASANDVFAVGEGGTILHYNGSSWSSMSSGTTTTLVGVWGSGGNDVFAVGFSGLILHYDGNVWTVMTSGITESLYDVHGTSSSNVYAVGYNGIIVHYDGEVWNQMSSGTTNEFRGVWTFCNRVHPGVPDSISTIFAVGLNHAQYYDGQQWNELGGSAGGLSVWGGNWNDFFAVTGQGGVLRFEGKVLAEYWNNLPDGYLQDIWGNSLDDIFAVGYAGKILHWDGSEWRSMNTGYSTTLHSVWGFDSDNVFAVGYGGTILHYGNH